MSKIRNNKKQRDAEFVNLFNKARKEYLEDTKGYSSVLEYIHKEYGGDKDFYCRIARKAGYSCMKRGNEFFLGE